MKVTNHYKFAMCNDYEQSVSTTHKLGDVVINDESEIGVIIQIHGEWEYRADKFGNCSASEVRLATLDEIKEHRPVLVSELEELKELRRELEKTVSDWIRTFNYLDVQVLEKYTDNCLFEHIRELPLDVHSYIYNDKSQDEVQELREEFLNDVYDGERKPFSEELEEEFLEWVKDEHGDEVREFYEGSKENYPMWSTCFEFKDSAWNDEETMDKIQALGMGIIQHEDFNTIIFMMSAGHSFLSSYWIPLYLALYSSEAEKYEGVDYSGL